MIKNALGGILLVGGTAVGAGTLALPIATAQMGYTNSILIFFLCWLFMTYSALLMLEANLRIAPGLNLVSMAEASLGTTAKRIAWLTYLMLFYALTAAYLSAASGWIQDQALSYCHIEISTKVASVLLVSAVGFLIYLGTHCADWTNRFLALLFIVAFGMMFSGGASHFSLSTLGSHTGEFHLFSLPIITTAFGFHIVIPTLTTYISCDKKLRSILLLGSLIPIVIYILWQTWVLGLLTPDALSMVANSQNPASALTQALQAVSDNVWLDTAATAITISVILTSFIGVTLSLFDFIADGLKLDATKHRKSLSFLTFLPPLICLLLFPAGFLFALSLAGIFVAILLGIYPALMVFSARYVLKKPCDYTVFGGKPLLALTTIFFTSVVCLECYRLLTA